MATLIITMNKAEGRPWINLNDRDHYMTKAKKTAAWIEETNRQLDKVDVPRMDKAQLDFLVFKPTRGRYDPHNLAPTMKAIVDAIVRYGIVPDDDYRHVKVTIDHGGISADKTAYMQVHIRKVEE